MFPSGGFLMAAAESSAAAPVADLSTFTEFGTDILSWMITTFGTILDFMLDNPICFVGLIVALIVTVIGTLRHIIGG